MTDPRLVRPQRVAALAEADACEHRYWCRTRITVVTLMALTALGLGLGAWWWLG